jgi:Zn-dependent M28 family amino/carboxypeptidase
MRYLLFGVLAITTLSAQDRGDRSDLSIVGRIKTEAFDNSQVMDTLQFISDQYGPRLTASPECREAADWAVKRLQSYGLENVHLEKWGPFGRSWSVKKYSVEMLEPRYALLVAAPLAWSDITHGPQTAEIMITPFHVGRASYNPAVLEADIEKYETTWKGKLKGKIVMLSKAAEIKPDEKPEFSRYTEKELADMQVAPTPTSKVPVDLKNLKIPEDPDEARRYLMSMPSSVLNKFIDHRTELRAKFAAFLKSEGVVAILNQDDRAKDGRLNAEAAGSYKAKDELAPPTFIVTGEQYNRMVRLAEKKVPVKVRVNLEAEYSKDDQDSYNIVGEIPGGSKKDEIVMLGGHFDSWHTGTGATDNGAGSAVMIEVVRILKTLNLKLDRTVRIALWTGEEEGLLGSKAYVKEHFGDPDTMKITEAHAKLSGYFNLDNGSGKVRGVYLQGNDAMRPVFDQWLSAFRDQGVSTITIRNTGGTDHLSFDAVGLPGFQFIQDPLDYGTLTHHSDIDTYDHLQAPDLMQAAAVIATVVYDAANRGEMLPRKELPKVQPETQAGVTATGTE